MSYSSKYNKQIFTLTVIIFNTFALSNPPTAKLLETDIHSRAARVDILQKAKKIMRAMYFIVGDDDSARSGLALAREAAKNGAEVRIIIDDMFNYIKPPMLRHLSDKGVHIRVYNPFRFVQAVNFAYLNRMHDKGLSIDGYLVQQGGRNAEDAYFGKDKIRPNYIDRDIEIESEAFAKQFDTYFDELWENADLVAEANFSKVKKKDVLKAANMLDIAFERTKKDFTPVRLDEVLKSIPKFELEEEPLLLRTDAESTVIRKIANQLKLVRESVFAETPYFVPVPEMMEQFRAWRSNRVDVRFTTNSPKSSDGAIAAGAYVNDRKRIARTGIEVYELKGPRTLHSKTAVLDRHIVLNGTVNADPRSLYGINSEIAVQMKSKGLAAAVLNTMDSNVDNSVLVAKDGNFFAKNAKPFSRPEGFRRSLEFSCGRLLSILPHVRRQI